jgi:hypothetical protein
MNWGLALLILVTGATLGALSMAFMKGADYPCEDCLLKLEAEERSKVKPLEQCYTNKPSIFEEYSEEFVDLPKFEKLRKRHK